MIPCLRCRINDRQSFAVTPEDARRLAEFMYARAVLSIEKKGGA